MLVVIDLDILLRPGAGLLIRVGAFRGTSTARDGIGTAETVCLHVHTNLLGLVFPISHRGVGAEKKHADTTSNQADEWDDKGDSPRLGRGKALVGN